jgi:organic radical activating enzyme
MFGKNPKLPFEKGDGHALKVHSMFLTIQGEGPYSGYQAVFIRLSGCNLACHFCDTEFDSFDILSVDEILERVMAIKCTAKLVVLTGGEPFRQNIALLCKALLLNNLIVQVETNGTLYTDIPKDVQLVCSPKNSNGKYHQVRSEILKQAIALKFLISERHKEYSDIAEIGQSKYKIPIYVQPLDEYDESANLANYKLAQKIAQKHNAIVSLQLHKILNIA